MSLAYRYIRATSLMGKHMENMALTISREQQYVSRHRNTQTLQTSQNGLLPL